MTSCVVHCQFCSFNREVTATGTGTGLSGDGKVLVGRLGDRMRSVKGHPARGNSFIYRIIIINKFVQVNLGGLCAP